MAESLERLDLLLLTVAKTRKVQADGVRFQGMRYIDPTLAAYVGETVVLRYDPRDVAEVRLFHQGKFLCRAICPGARRPNRRPARHPGQGISGAGNCARRCVTAGRPSKRLIELRRGSSSAATEATRTQSEERTAGPVLKRYRE